MSKDLLHTIKKASHDDHSPDEPCIGEQIDQTKGLTIRGRVDDEGTHWLSREDVLEFVRKERDTFGEIFKHVMTQGSFEPQYLLAGQILNGFGAILDNSTTAEEAVSMEFDEEAFAALLTGGETPEAPKSPVDEALGSIAEAIRKAKEEGEQA